MKRTPREWDEPCRACGGTGQVHKTQHFALWTSEEFEHSLKALAGAPDNAYICTTVPTATIHEACQEGMELAKEVGRPVAFKFLDHIVVVCSDSDLDKLIADWWMRQYGCTQEESIARR